MSRPRHYWYSFVKKMIMSPEIWEDKSLQAAVFRNAIKDATDETLAFPDGELRMKAVNEILIQKIRTYEGVGQEMNYDARTIQRWINCYVNLVGKKAGY